MSQHLVLDRPEAVEIAAPLFANIAVTHCNGTIPPELAGLPDVVVFGTDAEWVNSTAGQFVASGSKRVRTGTGDIADIDRAAQIPWLQARIAPYKPNPAPGQNPPAEAPPRSTEDAPDAGPDEVPPLEVYSAYEAGDRHAFADEIEGASPDDDWPDPADFWNVTALPEFLPDYLPGPLQDYVMDQASRAGVDPAQVALNCYVACAALLRCGIDLQMQEDSGEDGRTWREKPILWGAVIGDPSTGKGPALDIALHKFYKIASVLRAKDEAAWERYETEAKIHERRMQQYISKAVDSPLAEKPEAPQKPPRERLWTDDVTKEVVAKLLTENPRGKIAIIKDELASWFGGFDAYGNGKSDKDRPDWLSFYESKERYIDRAMEGRSYHVKSWGGIILGGIQPEVFQRIAGKLGADGMLQRFQLIIASPKRQVAKRPADAEAVRQWNRLCENLASMQAPQRSVTLSQEAAAFIDTQAQWIAASMQSGLPQPLVAALGKWEGLFGRLIITSHCIECAAVGSSVPSPVVTLKTAEQAWRWMRWVLWPHAVHFYGGMIDQGDELKSTRAFAEYVLARGITRIKPHVLNSGWSHYNRNFKTIQQRREFWARAEQSGWVRGAGTLDRTSSLWSEYEINRLAFDGRFSQQIESSRAAAVRYRQAMHPAFVAQQGRQPGEEG